MSQEQQSEETSRDGAALGWPTRRLRKISAFISKGSTPTTYGFKWEPAGVLFLRSECVSERGLDLTQSMFISEEAHATLRRSEATDGDILITITGNVGRVVRLRGIGRANMNQHIARVRVTAADAEPEFVFQVLAQPAMRAYFASITTGQAYPQISLVQVREAEVPFPPLDEQRTVSEALGHVDALLTKLDQLIAKKRDLRLAAMQQLLTGCTRLEGFAAPWQHIQMGRLGSFSKGRGLAKDDLARGGEVPAVPYTAIYTDFGQIASMMDVVGRVSRSRAEVTVNRPSLLIASSSNMLENIGKAVALCVDDEVAVGGDVLIFRTQADVRFLSYLLSTESHRRRVVALSQGSTIRHVYAATFSAYEVELPSRDEQVAIADALADIDAELAALAARREKTRQLKQGMMQALLTGRIRLV